MKTIAAAAPAAARSSRPRSHSPNSSAIGQALIIAPTPARAPNRPGRRWITSSPPIASTVGARSKRSTGSARSIGIASSQTQTPASLPSRSPSRASRTSPIRSRISIVATKS